MLVRGVQLLVEVQQLLLQGIEAPQADLAFLPPEPLLLHLLQALLLRLPQLQVENLRKGRSTHLSLGLLGFLFLHPQVLSVSYIFSQMGPEQEKDCPGSVTEARKGQVPHDCLPELRPRRFQPVTETPTRILPGSDLCSVPMLSF